MNFLSRGAVSWVTAPQRSTDADISRRHGVRPLNLVAPVREHASTLSADDAQLVERIRTGDRAAFDTLIRRYSSGLHQFLASRVDSVSAAEDLMQDLFLRIWKQRAQWSVRQNLRLYLYVAARNAAAIHRRHAHIVKRTAVDAERNDEALGMGASGESADRRTELGELSAAVQRAVEQLPPRGRQVAVLRLYQELSYADIAETMGITVKAVEGLFARALSRLRDQLASYL